MRFITTRVHGMLDYLSAIFLIASPWLFDFANGGAAQWTAVIVGAGILLMSILTTYEMGLVKAIPMPAHLVMDIIVGIFLAASPWLFGFSDIAFWPHLIIGIMTIGTGIFTHKMPYSTNVVNKK